METMNLSGKSKASLAFRQPLCWVPTAMTLGAALAYPIFSGAESIRTLVLAGGMLSLTAWLGLRVFAGNRLLANDRAELRADSLRMQAEAIALLRARLEKS